MVSKQQETLKIQGTANKRRENGYAKGVVARSDEQKQALRSIHENEITFISGRAGSGKTYLALHYGMTAFIKGTYETVVFTRPCVEAYGEKLGYLPGGADEKIAPYMIPLFDLLYQRYTKSQVERWIREGKIITVPLALMRGLTFNNCYVVADEMQNCVSSQMRLLLTRIGENSKIVVTGDIGQTDIHGSNGMADAVDWFHGVEGIASIELTSKSVVRNPLINTIEDIYASNLQKER